MATRALQVLITGDPSSLNRSLHGIDKNVQQSEARMKRFGSVAGAALKGVGLAAAAGAAVGIKKSADAAIEAEAAQSKMVTQLKAAGVSYKAHAKQIDEVIQKTSRLSGLDDEDLQNSFTNIVRVTGDVNKSLKLTGLAADFARAKHMDVAKAGELVGKVAGGNTGILSRYGITVQKGATAQEALALLQGKFAGQADAYGKTTQGAMDRAGVASENFGEIVGAKLTPLLATGANAIVDLVDKAGNLAGPIRQMSGFVADNSTAFKAFAGAVAGVGAAFLAAKIGASIQVLIVGIKALTIAMASNPIGAIAVALTALGGALVASRVKFGSFRKTVDTVMDAVRGAVKSVSTAVHRFAENNRESLQTAGQAMRNLGKAARYVFEEVVLPVIRTVIRAVVPILDGLKDTLSGLVRFVTSVFAGRWGKAWDALKDTVVGAIRTVIRVVRGAAGVLFTAAKTIGGQILKGVVKGLEGIGNAILNKIKGGISFAADKAKGFINAVNPFGDIGDGIGKKIGDGVGVTPSLGTPGLGGGGTMGADPDLTPFAQIGSKFGLRVSSGLRPGSITSSGNTSYHSSGDAIDEAGSPGGMMAYFRYLKKNFGAKLRELIYTPGGVGIKDGRPYRYTGQVAADHFDHVHVAYTGPFGDGVGQIKNLWTKAGGSKKAQSMAAAIAMAESGGNAGASNRNTDGSIDRGLWQINSVHGALSTFNRMGNARAAVSISGNGRNWNPWVTFKTGAYRQFLSSDGAAPGSRGGGGGGAASAAARARNATRRGRNRAITGARRQERNAPSGGRNIGGGSQPSSGSSHGVGGATGTDRELYPTTMSEGGASWGADTGSDTAGDAGTGEDPNQPLIDALNAATEAAKAQADALKSLTDEQKRDTDLRERIFSSQSGQIMAGIADMVSGAIGGNVGLGYQTPSFPGGRTRY